MPAPLPRLAATLALAACLPAGAFAADGGVTVEDCRFEPDPVGMEIEEPGFDLVLRDDNSENEFPYCGAGPGGAGRCYRRDEIGGARVYTPSSWDMPPFSERLVVMPDGAAVFIAPIAHESTDPADPAPVLASFSVFVGRCAEPTP